MGAGVRARRLPIGLVMSLCSGWPVGAAMVGLSALPAAAAVVQDVVKSELEGRPIARIEYRGLERVPEELVRNQLRAQPGQPVSAEMLNEDMRRLERLGEFRSINLLLEPQPDRSVVVVFDLVEAPMVLDVQVTGNRAVSDQELATVVADTAILIANVPIDDYRIGQAKRALERHYRGRGYYQVQVDVDESELETDGTVIFVIREGPKIKVSKISLDRIRAVELEGVRSVPESRIRKALETKTDALFRKGVLDDDVLDRDIATIVEIYRDEGYLDVRASHLVQPSPDGKEAIVTFLIEEGQQYTLRSVRVFGNLPDAPGGGLTVYTPEQVAGLLAVKPGDPYKVRIVEDAVEEVEDAYRRQGYVDARVNRRERRATGEPVVDIDLEVSEGRRFKLGVARITGNNITKDNVIRRDVLVKPDRWLDGAAMDETEATIRRTQLFDPTSVSVTLQREDPAYPGYRDILVNIAETNTSSLTFGAAVNSDSGLVGAISLSQRNFDIADPPDSLSEFLRGQAFRGAGQVFNITLSPGTEVSTFGLGFAEPRLLDSRYGVNTSAQYRTREYDDYDEERISGRLGLTRAFGTRWAGNLFARVEQIDPSDIDSNAPVDIFEVEDPHLLTGLGIGLARTTIDSRFRPTRGARTEIGVEQIGLMGGDFDFSKLGLEHRVFIPLHEDVLGRTTVLSFEGRANWIPQDDESPTYERYFLGGSNFRGFEYRGIGPVGIRNDTGLPGDDQVGGDFAAFLGVQVEQPVIGDHIALVAFIDSGTLLDDPGVEDWRVAAGLGVRLYIPALSPAPLAFDFAIPLVEEETDEDRLLTFSIDLPF